MATKKLPKFRFFVYTMFDGSLEIHFHAGKPKRGYDCKDYKEFNSEEQATAYYFNNR